MSKRFDNQIPSYKFEAFEENDGHDEAVEYELFWATQFAELLVNDKKVSNIDFVLEAQRSLNVCQSLITLINKQLK